MRLVIDHITCGYGKKQVLQDISFQVTPGDVVCLLGPNGVGKTTLFKAVLGLLPLIAGRVLLDERALQSYSIKELAKVISYVPQTHMPPFSFRVLDIVLIGRTAHIGMFASPGEADYQVAEHMLELLGIGHLATRSYTEISGGERQLVLVARSLAQQAGILIMDEPAANLDFGNQIRVLDAICQLAEQGLGILMTSHSPDHAFLCATKAALLLPDKQLLFGSVSNIVTEENLRVAYGVNVKLASVFDLDGREVQTCVPVFGRAAWTNGG